MSTFNKKSRTENTLKIALVAEQCTIGRLIIGFIYRTLFIHYLGISYLGINGLFSSILQLLSLADLGISSAIIYRFYKPIKEDDITQVGKLMNYFKKVYHIIFLVILGLGACILPFIDYTIKNPANIPKGINLKFIFLLFLLQTASTYIFAYKQSILIADQKSDKLNIQTFIVFLISNIAQIICLVMINNYTLLLLIKVVLNILGNYFISLYIDRKYPEVFKITETITKKERKEILSDTKACMIHKIGSVVLIGTDSIILSKLIGLVTVGMYSNYTLIINSLSKLVSQLLGTSVSSIGNARVDVDKEKFYSIYNKMNFLNLWVASSSAVCLSVLINPFIKIWLGPEMLFSKLVIICITLQYYISVSRNVNNSFIQASGLFVKDIPRPFIEAIINLIISIFLVIKIGIAGVFIGTIVSQVFTVYWRLPFLLHKYEFHKKSTRYWIFNIVFLLITLCTSLSLTYFFEHYITDIVSWIFFALITLLIIETLLIVVFRKCREFSYMKVMGQKFIRKIKKKL